MRKYNVLTTVSVKEAAESVFQPKWKIEKIILTKKKAGNTLKRFVGGFKKGILL